MAIPSHGRARQWFAGQLAELVAGGGTILDVGTSARFAKELAPHRGLFTDVDYVAAGYEPKRTGSPDDCDRHEDILALSYADGSLDGVICLEVLEHVADPFKAASELVRVLRPGGRLICSVPFMTSYHGKGGESARHDAYPDYWRFTHEGLQALFPGLSSAVVYPVDGRVEARLQQWLPHTVLNASLIRSALDRWDVPMLGKMTSRHFAIGRK